MSISASSIMSKVDAWSKTPEGKRRINGVVEKYQKEGKTHTAAGSRIINERAMLEAARKFISILRDTARDMDLPESIMKHFDSLDYSLPIRQHDGSMVVYVFFKDDLHRGSLGNNLGYDGIGNIVALFNNGYHAKNYVYGWWDGHRATGESISRSLYNNNFAWVRSKKEREPMLFVQRAIDEFNRIYGMEYNVVADETKGIYAQ